MCWYLRVPWCNRTTGTGGRYFIEGDHEHILFSRFHRSLAYQRAKGDTDTLPLGCRKDVYETSYEWVHHSMYPTHLDEDDSRVLVGANNPDCLQPYVRVCREWVPVYR